MDQLIDSLKDENIEELGNLLKEGSIAVIPTDTQYGIVTSALQNESVEKIYQLRKRSPEKPMIILLGSISQLQDFNITLTDNQLTQVSSLWPNPVSIIFPVTNPNLAYLHRGKNSLAFRIPQNKWLLKLLAVSGPLVAPSANWEGETPASTIADAKKYFSDQIATYVDNGEMNNPPSTILKMTESGFEIIRQGSFKLT